MSIWSRTLGLPSPKEDQATLATTTTTTGNVPIDPSGIGTTAKATLGQISRSLSAGLNQKDAQEMETLKAEYEARVKYTRIEKFKKVNSSLRQFVINSFEWENLVKEINNNDIDKPHRLTELETIDSMSRIYSGGYQSTGASLNVDGLFMGLFKGFTAIEGLSLDDLKKAHLDATLEEEVLNGQKEE